MGLIQTLLGTLTSTSFLPILIATLILTPVIYRLYLHPLAHLPGPLLYCFSSLPLYTICYLGIESRTLSYYHSKYGKVLRIAPNHVSISDGSAIHTIYVASGGFMKDARYHNFNLEGTATIFSSTDPAYRDARAKAVLPMFASGRVRGSGDEGGVMKQCIDEFILQFKAEKEMAWKAGPKGDANVDILDLSAKLSLDVVTGYLFNRRFGGLNEHAEDLKKREQDSNKEKKSSKLSLNPFIFTVVAFGRFSLFPNWLFKLCYRTSIRLNADEKLFASLVKIGTFVNGVVDDVKPKDDTYPSRLLAVGISKEETIKQCKAVMFAGTDSTSVKLATIIFHIIQNPNVLQRLKQEITELGQDPATDPQTFPYMRAVIREGLRLGVANSTRLTRVVPPSGFEVNGYYIPAGVVIGISPWMVHHNPELFPEPFKFRPERWMEDKKGTNGEVDLETDKRRKEMERDLIPFGTGSRACIARNLATHQLFMTVRALVESDVLVGAKTVKKRIEIIEWFNAEIKGHELEIQWT
ncbi:cytochrome P450 [Delitschia confertaspora ATCC 74209]|uniref:Cytochrome P450 n=1 Tax=Delitschia confertaspora ATCC 74209 TaxID=1513339 RepID=A0A9P4JRH5_9PLEO|nr:cytochrome P450 [Delitschia confertaspora ATCC 74209]